MEIGNEELKVIKGRQVTDKAVRLGYDDFQELIECENAHQKVIISNKVILNSEVHQL